MMDMQAINEYKKRILDVTMVMQKRGIYEYTMGHISARLPDSDMILIPGHIHPEHRTIESLTEEDITLINLDGKLIEGRLSPPGEKYIHTEIYKLRSDVRSVVHSHPKVATALGISGKEILPISLHSSIFYPKVPIHPYPGQIDTPELGRELGQLLGNGFAVIQQGHGAVNVGTTLEQACVVALLLEDCAELQLIAMTVGTPKALPEEYIKKGFKKGGVFTEDWELFGNPLDYYYNKYIVNR